LTNRDLGELGEATLKTWVAQVGVTANKASQDKRGWDFILEFPYENIKKNTQSFDKSINPMQSLIQVKSTDNNTGRLSIKLSNWIRLVKTKLPAFFLILDFNGGNRCQKAYLIHVYKDEIKRVLKRIRKLSSKIDSLELNKKTLSLKWSDKDLISSLDGKGLTDSIAKHIGDFDTYSMRKNELIEKIGYENEKGKITFNMNIPDYYREDNFGEFWVDFTLGIIEDIEIEEGEIWDLRFGIPSPQPIKKLDPGTVFKSIPEHSEDVLLIREVRTGNEIRIPVKVIVPAGIEKVAKKEDLKMLLKFPEGHIIIAPFKSEIKYKINIPDPLEKFPYKKLDLIADIILFMKNIDGEIELFLGTDSLGNGLVDSKKIPEDFYKWAEKIKKISDIAKSFKIMDQLIVKPIELWQEKDKIKILNLLLSKEPIKDKIRFSFDANEDISEGERVCIPHVMNIFIGEFNLLIVSAFLGRIIPKETSAKLDYLVEVEESKIIRKQALNIGEEFPKSESDFAKEVEELYKNEFNILNVFDKK